MLMLIPASSCSVCLPFIYPCSAPSSQVASVIPSKLAVNLSVDPPSPHRHLHSPELQKLLKGSIVHALLASSGFDSHSTHCPVAFFFL